MSGICSMRPAPNTGVGMRKLTFRFLTAASKFSCWPQLLKRECTPPSGVPLAFRMNLASRIGPFLERNDGTVLPNCGGERHLRIHGRAGAAGRRLRVASSAAVEVHGRPETIRDGLLPPRSRSLPSSKCASLARRQARQRCSRRWRIRCELQDPWRVPGESVKKRFERVATENRRTPAAGTSAQQVFFSWPSPEVWSTRYGNSSTRRRTWYARMVETNWRDRQSRYPYPTLPGKRAGIDLAQRGAIFPCGPHEVETIPTEQRTDAAAAGALRRGYASPHFSGARGGKPQYGKLLLPPVAGGDRAPVGKRQSTQRESSWTRSESSSGDTSSGETGGVAVTRAARARWQGLHRAGPGYAGGTPSCPCCEPDWSPIAIVHADTLDVYDLLDFLGRRHQRVKRSERAVRGLAQIGGVENFWSQARRNLRKYNGIPPHHFHLFLKECEWRFNYGSPRQLSETLVRWLAERPEFRLIIYASRRGVMGGRGRAIR